MSQRNRQKLRRRQARAANRDSDKANGDWRSDRSARRIFSAKSRKGDSAAIEFGFSALPVPYDEADPTHGLQERTAVVAHLAKQTKGTAN